MSLCLSWLYGCGYAPSLSEDKQSNALPEAQDEQLCCEWRVKQSNAPAESIPHAQDENYVRVRANALAKCISHAQDLAPNMAHML